MKVCLLNLLKKSVIFLFLFLVSASSASAYTILDEFSGQIISPYWEIYTYNGGSISQNEKLFMEIVDQPVGEVKAVFRSKVIGDFDIRVEYSDLILGVPQSSQVMARIHVDFGSGYDLDVERSNGAWGDRYIGCCSPLIGGRSPCWTPTWTPTTATSGTFGITRENDLITLSYTDVLGMSDSYTYSGSMDPGLISLHLRPGALPGGPSSNSRVSWDNFTISADAFVPSLEPVPEPTTMLLFGSGLIGLLGFRRRFK
jgi:hypothetical protein